MPANVYALYVFDSRSDSLICEVALGDQQNALLGLTIPVGERVSGWVGANRQTAMNSDATLDLGETARVFQPALRSTISTALANNLQLVGVLTAYSASEAAFTDGHRYVFEQVALVLLPAIAPAQANPIANVVSFRGPKQQAGG
jgi:putative methionine-R-sulfoxide reductase with GAF domain